MIEIKPSDAPRTAPHPAEILLAIEAAARYARDLKELSHVIANETRKIIRAGQIFVFRMRDHKPELMAISSLSTIDRTAPLVQDFEDYISRSGDKLLASHVVSVDDMRDGDAARFAEIAFAEFLFCPLNDRQGESLGLVVLGRNEAWRENEINLFERLAGAYAHAWSALVGHSPFDLFYKRKRKIIAGSAAVLLVLSLVPVPLTALAPCEIVPFDAELVTAPIDGTIETVLIEPNTVVTAGEGLVNFVDTTIRGRLDVAERSLEVASAREKRVQQSAFDDRNSRRDWAVAAAELRLAIAERDAAAEQLARTKIVAARSGIAIFSSRKDYEGRPVSTGERLMQIADPMKVQLRIDMAIKDAAIATDNADVRAYLDSDPLRPIDATLDRVSYHASSLPGGGLAFVVYARLDAGVRPRIGYRGTAQIFGPRVPLIYYLLRRPLTSVRQMVGL